MAAVNRKIRRRILQFLRGQLNVALEGDPNHSWLFKDEKGDKLQNGEDKHAARLEAHRLIRNFEEEIALLQD